MKFISRNYLPMTAIDDKINGEVLEFHKNGNVMFKETQIDGKLVGNATHYYENGKLRTEYYYKADKRLLINEWDSSGKLLLNPDSSSTGSE